MKKFWRLILLTPIVFATTGCDKWPTFYLEENNKYSYHTNVQYGEYIRTFVDICLPKQVQAPGLVMFIHGGDWTKGDKSSYKEEVIEYATKYGVTCASMNYHYVTKGEYDVYTELNDITCAINKVYNYSLEKNVKLKRMILAGDGAGAHLSALYASRCYEQSIIPIVATWLNSPVTSLYSDAFIKENAKDEKEMIQLMSKVTGVRKNTIAEMEHELKDLSPVEWVLPKTPRTLICIGAKDEFAPFEDNLNYVETLNNKSIQCDVVKFMESGHELENDTNSTQIAEQLRMQYIEDFFF